MYIHVSCSGWVKRADLSAIVYLSLCVFCSARFPLPLGSWDVLHYFIVALPGHSIYLLYLLRRNCECQYALG